MKKENSFAHGNEKRIKLPWESMTLTPVGTLGAVIQSMMGSGADGGTMASDMKS